MAHKSGEDFLSALLEEPVDDTRDLQLLLTREPRHHQLLGDLRYLQQRKPTSPPPGGSAFGRDVFVPTRVPWITFVESLVYHALAIVAMLIWAQWQPRHITQQAPWKDTRFVVYPVSPKNDLPKLDTGSAGPHHPQTGDPAYARQPILSVPREPDNRAQTIVTPPDIVLHRDVRMPNIVAWTTSALPLAPAPAVPVLASERSLVAPQLSVIAPPPQVDAAHHSAPTPPQAPPVAPPPQVQAAPPSEPAL